MPQLTLHLPKLHTAQQEIKQAAVRFNVLDCGRRFGKDVLLMDRLIEPALRGYPTAWFSPSFPMMTEVWRSAKSLLHPVIARTNAQEHRIELITNGVIDMWSLDAPDTARGRKYARVIVNEAAISANLQVAWEEVIRPTLTDYEGDAYFGSTPKGRNYFWRLFLRGVDPGQPDWKSWKRPTRANPYINPAEIEVARAELPSDIFLQEYEAEFNENGGSVFRNIAANMTAPPDATPADHIGHVKTVGVDWAQKQDFTAISVGCANCKMEVQLDRFNQIAWDVQRDRLQTIWRKWGVQWGYAEENSIGGPNIEALQREGLDLRPFTTTSQSKGQIIKSLALALEREEIRWQSDPVGTGELESYEVKLSAQTGHSSYSAPAGSNDDTVIARALNRKAMLEGLSTGVFF